MRYVTATIALMLSILQLSAQEPTKNEARQSLDAVLSSPVAAFQSTKEQSVDQLIELATTLKIPMGIETSYRRDEKPAAEIHIQGGTARDVIDQIIQGNPRYSWRTTQGVVNVFDRTITDDERNFLNLRLPYYRVVEKELLGASYWLLTYIDIALHPEKYTRGFGGGYGHGSTQPPGWDKFNISMEAYNASVREILNALVVANGNSLWISSIDPGYMMKDGFFAQREHRSSRSELKTDFYWELIPLRER